MVTPCILQDYANGNRPDIDVVVSVNVMRYNHAYYWLAITLVSFVVAGLREEMWRAGSPPRCASSGHGLSIPGAVNVWPSRSSRPLSESCTFRWECSRPSQPEF